MRKRTIPTLLLAVVVSLSPSGAAPPDATKLSPEKVRERFYGIWLEEEKVSAGKRTTDPYDLLGQDFGEREWPTWLRRGEMSASRGDRGVRIDPTTDPMRIDLLDGTDAIKPGIFKFEGGKLVLAVADHWITERKLGKGEDYRVRPKEFKSTKDNGVTLYVLRRGSWFFAQD